MSKKGFLFVFIFVSFFLVQIVGVASFVPCYITEGGGQPGCGWVETWGSTDIAGKVLQAAKNNPGTQFMAWCPRDGATPYARNTVSACQCPTLRPAPGECLSSRCSACSNPTAKCSPDIPPPGPGALEGHKYNKETMEKLNGWQIILKKNGVTVRSTFTGLQQAGFYRFSDLDPGTYTVEEIPESGWEVPSGYSRIYTIVIHSEQTKTQNFFNQKVKGCLEGYKRDNVGVGLPDWQIHVKNINTGQEFVTMTEGTGKYKFSRLDAGNWEVWEEMQSGWEVAPGHSLKYTVTVSSGSTCKRQDFVNKQKEIPQKGCVNGIKRDDNHVGLQGWTIHAKKAGQPDSSGISTVTGPGGRFSFSNLDSGLYEFWEDLKPQWEPVTSARFRAEVVSANCIDIGFKNKFGCVDECRSGQKKCQDNGIWQCGNYDSDECLEWGKKQQCGEDSCISHTNLNPFLFEFIQDLGSCNENFGNPYCGLPQTIYDACLPNSDTVKQPYCKGNDHDFQLFDCNSLDGCYEFNFTACVSCPDMYGNCVQKNCTRIGKEYRDYQCGAGKCMFSVTVKDLDKDRVDDRCDDCIDVDGDGICDQSDNCPTLQNENQVDTDKDGRGDFCDNDRDGDGYGADEDCNDWNFDINPGKKEILNNGLDDDCNPKTPDRTADTSQEVFYVDIQTTDERNLVPGSNLIVSVSVKNNGQTRQNNVQVAISLPDYQIIQTKIISELNSQETEEKVFVITLPNSFISRYETMRVSVGNDDYKRVIYRELQFS